MKSPTESAAQQARHATKAQITISLIAAALVIAFWYWRSVVAPLPVYSFQSDPETPYFQNALLLANGKRVEHTDHPGTALQLTGAVIARGLGLTLNSAADVNALQQFLRCWRLVALSSLLTTGLWLASKLKHRGGLVLAATALLFAFDYQTLVYWLTFTPESAFYVLYLPASLVCALTHIEGEKSRLGCDVAWSAGLGFLTTIKLTLWPVTFFLLGLIAFGTGINRQGGRRFAIFAVTALLTYAVVTTTFAHDRDAPWRWLLGLIEHSGRYGSAQPGEGIFPSFSVGLNALRFSFALQGYTTLPVFVAIIALAVGLLTTRHTSFERWRSAGFLLTLALLMVMFFKHPYQGKYLMPTSLLCILFFSAQVASGWLPGQRPLFIVTAVFALAAINAVLTQKLLFDSRIPRDRVVYERIETWLKKSPHDALVIAGRMPHPMQAFRYAIPPTLWPYYKAHFGPVDLITSYSRVGQDVIVPELPLVPGTKNALAFINVPSTDPRWQLVDSLPDGGLYVYRSVQ